MEGCVECVCVVFVVISFVLVVCGGRVDMEWVVLVDKLCCWLMTSWGGGGSVSICGGLS